jgi:3-deoxy-D-manno-octulosonic-acid transferase
MHTLYNFFQFILLILLFPLIFIYICLHQKYRSWIPLRLGKNLREALIEVTPKKQTIWIHALSVGEVTSALPLAAAVNEELPESNIIFSTSTRSGYELGKTLLSPHCRAVIPFPLDLLPVCRYFIRTVSPDVFILVETDFWPNFLRILEKKQIPAILVNGRVSQQSMAHYSTYSSFFKPMFSSLSYLCVQTESDRRRFIDFGMSPEKVLKLGNLKYEPTVDSHNKCELLIPDRDDTAIFIAGSTHQGEEEFILEMFLSLQKEYSLKLIIAPRDIQRAEKIAGLAKTRNISVQLRSAGTEITADLLILDTIGELTAVYGAADICFVGGSLVNEGGHNPLEPAYHGKPVIFGPDMSDFEEISQDLVTGGGAFTVTDQAQLRDVVKTLLEDNEYRQKCGRAAQERVATAKGVLRKHVELIKDII